MPEDVRDALHACSQLSGPASATEEWSANLHACMKIRLPHHFEKTTQNLNIAPKAAPAVKREFQPRSFQDAASECDLQVGLGDGTEYWLPRFQACMKKQLPSVEDVPKSSAAATTAAAVERDLVPEYLLHALDECHLQLPPSDGTDAWYSKFAECMKKELSPEVRYKSTSVMPPYTTSTSTTLTTVVVPGTPQPTKP